MQADVVKLDTYSAPGDHTGTKFDTVRPRWNILELNQKDRLRPAKSKNKKNI